MDAIELYKTIGQSRYDWCPDFVNHLVEAGYLWKRISMYGWWYVGWNEVVG